jgi:hypothetical protein
MEETDFSMGDALLEMVDDAQSYHLTPEEIMGEGPLLTAMQTLERMTDEQIAYATIVSGRAAATVLDAFGIVPFTEVWLAIWHAILGVGIQGVYVGRLVETGALPVDTVMADRQSLHDWAEREWGYLAQYLVVPDDLTVIEVETGREDEV